jgi:hypothetical protein
VAIPDDKPTDEAIDKLFEELILPEVRSRTMTGLGEVNRFSRFLQTNKAHSAA